MTQHQLAPELTRRNVLFTGAALSIPALISGCSSMGPRDGRGSDGRAPTPGVGDAHSKMTHEVEEGPYYRLLSPEKTALREEAMPGVPLLLTGRVLSTTGDPLAHILLDFWHADDSGTYDLRGYRLRGHQFTDADGHYALETVMPGLYGHRTRHIHVKVQPPGDLLPKNAEGLMLTTQLYFPGEPRNEHDDLFDRQLLMAIESTGDGRRGTFDFALEVS